MTLSNKDFELLLKANVALSSQLNVEDVLVIIMKLASEVVGAEAASILLLDERTNELYFDVALGKAGESLKPFRLRVGEGLAGWVAREKKTVIVNDVTQDPRWTSRADTVSDFGTRSILAVPVMFQGTLIGVVEAINKKSGAGFTPDDQQVFEAFTAQAAVAIENARLFSSLRQEKEKLSTVFSQMSDGAVLLEEGKVLLANRSACQYLGWSESEVMGQTFGSGMLQNFKCSPPLERLFFQSQPNVKMELFRKSPTELRLTGVLHSLASANPEEPKRFLLVFRDVTVEKKEDMIKKTFLGLISHKLKTPLVPIMGYSELLLNEAEGKDLKTRNALETIHGQAQRLADLVEKLLSFARLESESMELNLQSLKVSDCVRRSLSTLARAIQEKDGQVQIDESLSQVPLVQGDPELTTEVFKNLIENAFKFNDKPAKTIMVRASLEDGFVCVQIEDNGPGVPPEELPHIFDKFHQIESYFTGQVPGAGLGLALCKRIVDWQNGKISLTSRLGHGSTFSVFLPVKQ